MFETRQAIRERVVRDLVVKVIRENYKRLRDLTEADDIEKAADEMTRKTLGKNDT